MHVLYVTATRLGDAVLSTGAAARLGENARVTVACGPVAAELFATLPGVVRVLSMEKQKAAGHWRKLWRETIGTRWDLVVDLRNSPMSRLLRKRKLISIGRADPTRHVVEQIATTLGFDTPPAPRVALDDASRAEAASLIPDDGRKLLALAPGAASVGKRWPAARWSELAQRLTGSDLRDTRIVLLGAGDDAKITAEIAALLPGAIDLANRTRPLVAAALLERAALYVGNDSGLTHLAAATGCKTLALFGPGLPRRYRPWGANAAYAIAHEDPQRTTDLCKIDDTLATRLMEALSVDDVYDKARALAA
ncbi:glycosyltransferase family 9 protein [Roseiterribacter gracilis]|uniref:glycosyltransferase family 9 protein n=1 Tax=Roseiterribacter gracilis TaxID=2812848 RepID=UPI003B43BE1C